MIILETTLPLPFKFSLLEEAANAALQHQSAAGSLTLVLTTDEELHRLNREYLGVDKPTDVLSFPAAETDPETGELYLGDILISMPRTEIQARVAGHPPADEARRVLRVLEEAGGNRAEAARRLGMSRTTLWKLLKRVNAGGAGP
jgi:probable rRNA maturation factor